MLPVTFQLYGDPTAATTKLIPSPIQNPQKGKITLLSIHIKEIQFNVFRRLSTFYDSHRLLIKETGKKKKQPK